MIQVHCPNGMCLEFPDETPPDVIEAKKAEFGGQSVPGPAALPPEAMLAVVQGVAGVAQSIMQQLQGLQVTAGQVAQAAAAISAAAQQMADAVARIPDLQPAIARVEAAILAPTTLQRDQSGRPVGARKVVR